MLLAVLVVLAQAGSRAAIARPDAAPAVAIVAGHAVPICHSGQDGDGTPSRPDDHRCCDACLLGGTALPPASPNGTRPLRREGRVRPVFRLASNPNLPRVRSPRSAQGPPQRAS